MATSQKMTLPARTAKSKLQDLYTLTKPEVNLLILMTTSAGYYLASRGGFKLAGLINTLIGTLLVASGTATLNQWMERGWDGQMRRTADRPIPSGRMSSMLALIFGILLSLGGGVYLAATVNLLAAALAVSTLLSYLLIYTPLKRVTPLCTLLGAIPGAMPTLIGWAGGAGRIDPQAWYLFAILFLWQFPHFLAIAMMYKDDYARAGYKMLPDFDADSRFTRAEIVFFTIALIVTTMLPLIDRGGAMYIVGMFLAGTFLLYYALKLSVSGTKALARQLVHASVIYLPVILGLMVVLKK